MVNVPSRSRVYADSLVSISRLRNSLRRGILQIGESGERRKFPIRSTAIIRPRPHSDSAKKRAYTNEVEYQLESQSNPVVRSEAMSAMDSCIVIRSEARLRRRLALRAVPAPLSFDLNTVGTAYIGPCLYQDPLSPHTDPGGVCRFPSLLQF